MNKNETEVRHSFNDSFRQVEISEEDKIIGAQTYELFHKRLARPPAWSIKNGQVKITRTGEIIDGLEHEKLSPELARVITGFKMVEDFLPDYMGRYGGLVRSNMGLSMINTQWAREELNHGLALGNILVQTGHTTPEQVIKEYQENLQRTWESPYPTARRVSAYAVFQEEVTCWGYLQLEKRAIEEDASKTARNFKLIAGDESYHGAGFTEVMKIYHKMDPEDTTEDILDVARNFKMPAENLHPNPLQWVKDLIKVGAYNKPAIAEKVIYPVLKSFRFIPENVARETTEKFLRKK